MDKGNGNESFVCRIFLIMRHHVLSGSNLDRSVDYVYKIKACQNDCREDAYHQSKWRYKSQYQMWKLSILISHSENMN